MDKSKIENAINHITSLQEKLCYCENNLQYVFITIEQPKLIRNIRV